ncbi:MAG: AAA family ATPase [Thermoproteota archaeon]
MRLSRIEVRNFKSIKERQVINLDQGLIVITGRNGSGKCLAPWTIVEQPYGPRTIESIFKEFSRNGLLILEEGAEYVIPYGESQVLSYSKYLNRTVEAPVSAIFRKNYQGLLLKIETSSGMILEATPGHRLLMVSGDNLRWVKASRLSEGTRIMVADKDKIFFDEVSRIIKVRWCGEVYDLYVEGLGSYVAGGGIVVHNSNLIDAIRFALGENNPRLLRTDRLSALVNDRAGKDAEAYVKITIDNSDLLIPGQDKVITVVRRMGRDGESTYYLNGRRAPKNVVEDTISSAGLSARGYNIIIQGEIARIADKNPVERRREIEQALGLAQYDEKKAEALINLQQADNNLRVAQARLQEIDRRMLQLERERNIFIRRRMIEKEIERIESMINSWEYHRILKKVNEISEELVKQVDLRSMLEAELAKKNAEKKDLMKRMEEILRENRLTTPDAASIKIEYELKDYERQLAGICEDIKEKRIEFNLTRDELSRLRRKMYKTERKILSLKDLRKEILRGGFSISSQISRFTEEKKRLQELARKKYEEEEKAANRLSLIKKEFEKALLEKEASEKMLQEFFTNYLSIKKKIMVLENRKMKGDVKRRRIIDRIKGIEMALAERKGILENITNMIKILTESLDALRLLFAKTSVMLSSRIRDGNMDKIIEIVKSVSKKKGLSIYGTLRENISYPKETARAIESIAGEWLDSILVKNSLEMLTLMNILRGRVFGFRVFISEGNFSRKEIPRELKGRGIHLMDIIKYPKTVEKHILKLFWNSILVKSVEDALAFVAKGFKAVTFNGEVFTSEGSLVIEDTETGIGNLMGILRGFSEKATELSAIIEYVNSYAKPVLSRRILEDEDLKRRLAESLNFIDLQTGELERRLTELTREYLKISEKLSQIFRANSTGRISSLKKEIATLERFARSRGKKRGKIQGMMRSIEKKISRLERENRIIGNRLREIDTILNSLNFKAEKLRILKEKLVEKKMEIRKELRRLLDQAKTLEARISEIRKSIDKSDESIVEGEQRELVTLMENVDKEIEKLNLEINRMKDVERRLLVEKEVNENKLQELRVRIQGQPVEVSEEKAGIIEKYLSILREEFGNVQEVNMLAVNQYEQELAFYRNALERINELEDERRSIQEFMDGIEKRKREAFLNGLNKINSYFSYFFNKITGGEGWLQPEDPDKPFESGLMVYVKFPGKEARIISGVSGGEKSVAALCLVFALQKLFPAAFYVFDEPDAHLDYVNVERMMDLLREVSRETQILIISLRDVVVSRADKVIGVYVKNGFSRFIEMPRGKTLEETAIVG